MSDEALESAPDDAPNHEREIVQTSAAKHASRTASARKAFAEAVVASKPKPAAEPPRHEPDPDLERLHRELAERRSSLDADRAALEAERGKQRSAEDMLEEYADSPTRSTRQFLESMHGQLDDAAYRREVADLITTLSTDVLGVPLPMAVRAKMDAAQARKMISAGKTAAARRSAKAAEREKAERESRDAHERQWTEAAAAIAGKLGDRYPHIAGERDAGERVVKLVRAAGERGERLTWRDAAKQLEDRLRGDADARKPAPPRAEPPKPRAPWSKEGHRAETLAALRASRKA